MGAPRNGVPCDLARAAVIFSPIMQAADPAPEQLTLTADDALVGVRLDRAFAERFPHLSRSRVKALILGGSVTTVTDKRPVTDPSYKLAAGACLILTVPPSIEDTPRAEHIALSIVYEDEEVIVVNKPAGMVVHPAPGNSSGTLVNALLAHCGDSLSGIGGVKRPGIVHRLDKDTSGLMVAAKTERAHHSLAAQFAERRTARYYDAVVWGTPQPTSGEVEGNIGRSPHNRQKMAVVTRGGKPARTLYRVCAALGPAHSLVECRLATGRTHQVRVHMAHIGHPLVGDPLYGRADRRRRANLGEAARRAVDGFGRQALHARTLGFAHPVTGEGMHFEAPRPADMESLMEALAQG